MRERIETSRNLCVDVFEGRYAAVHSSGMDIDIPALLSKMMEVVPGKQTGLANRLGEGISQPQVSRWLKGSVPEVPNYERIIAVAEELGVLSDVRSEDIAEAIDRGPRKTVIVKGYVGAGGETHIYNVASAGELDTIEASDRDTDQTVALRIIGTSLGAFFNRWYVLYDDVRSPVTDDLIGKLCVVGLSDDRVLIKKIARHGRTKRFDLFSNAEGEPAIKNVSIEWAAKVNDLRQG